MVVFYVSRKTSPGVFASQVLPILADFGFSVCLYDSGSNEIERMIRRVRAEGLINFRQLLGLCRRPRQTIIVTREIVGYFRLMLFALLNKNLKIKHDFRALYSEELRMHGSNCVKPIIARAAEKFIWRNATSLRVVSHNMAKYCSEQFGYRSDVLVVPSFFSDTVAISGSHKSKHTDFVGVRRGCRYVYVGGMSVWQCFDKTIWLFMQVCREGDSLTVYTRDQRECEEIVKNYGATPLVRIKTASHEVVLEKLVDFDFGFILREDSLVNTLSSPLKFLEYTSRGVIPIMTAYVGDYPRTFHGLYINADEEDISLIRNNIERMMMKRAEVSKLLTQRSATLSYSAYREKIKSWILR